MEYFIAITIFFALLELWGINNRLKKIIELLGGEK